jgi:hypothetical protein
MEQTQKKEVFRKETMERISSPEQLTGYLRVTKPGIWVVLAAVILLLAAMLAWSAVGVLETTTDAKVVVSDASTEIIVTGTLASSVQAGMPVRVASEEYTIASVETDEYGRTVAFARTDLPNGIYDAKIVVEQTKPISFLLESR